MIDIEPLHKKFEDSETSEVIRWALDEYKSDIVIATSFGPQGMIIIDMAHKTGLPFDIGTIDTGKLPEETYELMEKVREKYQIPIQVFFPDLRNIEKLYRKKGFYSFRNSISDRQECCRIRKVLPFYRALNNYKAWFSGLRKGQSETRSYIDKFQLDRKHRNILKINPLVDWTEEEVWNYIRSHNIPYNKLHDQNYPSIGCSCCTRAIKTGENIRAGRWWWEPPESKECGIHVFGIPMTITIFMDLDGTILDTQNRHYQVYQDILKDSPQSILSQEAYWSLKRAGFSVSEIFKQTGSGENTESFLKEWMSRIESENYLKQDILFPKIYKILDILSQEYRLVMISGRKNRKGLLDQLDKLKLSNYFSEILNSPSGDDPAEAKVNLIRKTPSFNKDDSWIVGDTEADILAGKRLGIKTVGVLSGIRNETRMKELKSDYTIEDITNLSELLFFESNR